MLGFGDDVGGGSMFGQGWCGVGGVGHDSVLEVGAWEACLSVHDKLQTVRAGGGGGGMLVSCPGLYVWHGVVAGSVRFGSWLARHGVFSCRVTGSRCMHLSGLLGCSACGMVSSVALTCGRGVTGRDVMCLSRTGWR